MVKIYYTLLFVLLSFGLKAQTITSYFENDACRLPIKSMNEQKRIKLFLEGSSYGISLNDNRNCIDDALKAKIIRFIEDPFNSYPELKRFGPYTLVLIQYNKDELYFEVSRASYQRVRLT